MDIHNYKRRFERTLERLKEAKDICKENKKILLKFKDYCISEGIGIAKIERYIFDAMKYAKSVRKPFDKANKENVRAFVAELEQTTYSAETKKCIKIMLRKLYRFIEGIEEKGEYPEIVKWISVKISENHKRLPEELLSEEEVMKIVQKCDTLRNKALITSLYESGCRISEIGTMKIKHISFEEYGARLHVQGKTGMRKILVINCTPYLQEWLNRHPDNNNPDAHLWIKKNGQPLSYTRMVAILKDATKRAKIKKRVYPHLLRHSRATFLANKMTEAAMKQYFGWTQGSNMAATYIHMSGKDTDEAILKAAGIEVKKEEEKSPLQPKKCLRCHTINEVTNKFCKICGLPLQKSEAQERLKAESERRIADDLMNNLIKDPEVLELIKKKLGD